MVLRTVDTTIPRQTQEILRCQKPGAMLVLSRALTFTICMYARRTKETFSQVIDVTPKNKT
jgi:hypothetical protein